MLEITNVHGGSIAQELDIRRGDKIISVNGKEINDQIDFRFHSAEENIDLLIERNSEQLLFEIEKEFHEDLGVDLQEMKMMACGNNCVFCFVFQNPKGMRKQLYFKDEDYRFSFLYGHYVTLTTATEADLKRIVQQQLSPLYISVHSTEEKTRKLLLGNKREDHLLEKIDYLVKNGIELHTQIVLCPGINDGKVFDQTVNDLKQYYPGIKSVAVVPIGLTRFRENLFRLRLHSKTELRTMIEYTNKLRTTLRKELGDYFVYLADEFFIKADAALPPSEYYDDFYQIENGVGEFRDMIDRFNIESESIPQKLDEPIKITWISGTLAAATLNTFIISHLNKIKNLRINLVAVENNFFGNSISVSGLLVGEDIYNALKDIDCGDIVLLPPRVLNQNNLFLDDWTIPQLEQKLGVHCHVYSEPVSEIIDVVTNIRAIA